MCSKYHPVSWPECEHYEHHHPGVCYLVNVAARPEGWKLPKKMPAKKTNQSNQSSTITTQPSPYTFTLGGDNGLMASEGVYKKLGNGVLYDGGANQHIFNRVEWFEEVVDLSTNIEISASTGGSSSLQRGGTVILPVKRSDGSHVKVVLKNAVFNPDCPCNLVSPGILKELFGVIYDGDTDRLLLRDTRVEVAQLHWENRHPWFDVAAEHLKKPEAFLTVTMPVMHQRLMHAGVDRIKQVCEEHDITLTGVEGFFCEACALAKSKQIISTRPPTTQPTALFQMVYGDTINMKPKGYGGFSYAMHLVDAFLGYQWMLMLKSRKMQEYLMVVEGWLKRMETQTGLRVLGMQIDNAGEFRAKEATAYYKKKGFVVRLSPPNTHQPMGRIERSHRTFFDLARSTHIEAHLPEFLWPYTFEAVVYVNNRLPYAGNEGNASPTTKLAGFLGLQDSWDYKLRVPSLTCEPLDALHTST